VISSWQEVKTKIESKKNKLLKGIKDFIFLRFGKILKYTLMTNPNNNMQQFCMEVFSKVIFLLVSNEMWLKNGFKKNGLLDDFFCHFQM
jgi:hypothetical protein